MHPDYCAEGPRAIATLTIIPDALPLTPAHRDLLVGDLEHLAEMLSMWACELRKGEHVNTVRARFFERVAGLGPAVLVRFDDDEDARRARYRL